MSNPAIPTTTTVPTIVPITAPTPIISNDGQYLDFCNDLKDQFIELQYKYDALLFNYNTLQSQPSTTNTLNLKLVDALFQKDEQIALLQRQLLLLQTHP